MGLVRRAGTAVAAVALGACGVLPAAQTTGPHSLVVGAFAFNQSRPSAYGWALPWSWQEGASSQSESQVLAELYAEVLRGAGYSVRVETLSNFRDVEPAVERGRLDLIPAYAASLLEDLDGGAGLASPSITDTMTHLQEWLRPRGLLALDPADAVDVNGFAVRASTARHLHLRTLSDLAPHAKDMVLGAPPECPKRPFCLVGLQRYYGLHFAGFKALDIGHRTKAALRAGSIDVGEVLTTDTADLANYGLVLLQDDRHLQLADAVVPVVRRDRAAPALQNALNRLQALLSTRELARMNQQVGRGHATARTVARHWLEEVGLS